MNHPLANVGAAQIGDGTRIWQFASVIRGAIIGRNCNIGSCAIVDGAKIGDGTTVGHGVSLNPGIIVGNNVFIGPNATFCNDLYPRVGKDGFEIERLLSGALVTTIVEDGASIGAGAVVLPGIVIGAGAMVAAGATVCRDVPAWHIFYRPGFVSPIDPVKSQNRMKAAKVSP